MAAARTRQGDPTTVLALLREIEPGSVPRNWAEMAWWARDAGVATVVLHHADVVRAAAYSPDGKRVVSASADKAVRIWNADDSGEPLVFKGHEDNVQGVAFSSDGKHIASASWDKTVRVWNADGTVRVWNAAGTGEPLVFRASDAVINAAFFSPDGQRIIAASDDGTIIVWSDLEPRNGAGDPRLWEPTRYCMPLEVRRRLLDFSEAQSREDLARCQRKVGMSLSE
jgi:WD40 repeat protein